MLDRNACRWRDMGAANQTESKGGRAGQKQVSNAFVHVCLQAWACVCGCACTRVCVCLKKGRGLKQGLSMHLKRRSAGFRSSDYV